MLAKGGCDEVCISLLLTGVMTKSGKEVGGQITLH